MPSGWSTALPSLTTLLLAKPTSDWSTAITSLTILLLAKAPSDSSTAHQSLTILLSANPPSDWFCVGRVSSSDQAHWSLKGPNRVKVLCAKTTSNQAFL